MSAEDQVRNNQTPDEVEPASGSPPALHPVSPWLTWAGLIGIVLVTIAAGIGRLLRLDMYPGGMTEAEAAHGVLARQSGDFGLRWAIENAESLSIPLMIVISWIGNINGFDIATPRIAAALFGTASVVFSGLWLHRAMGPLWGFAGAAVLAGSFWHILFSRMAIGQIAGAFALAALCWFLTEAASRRGPHAAPWYGLAGLATGIGFLATPTLRLLPLVMLGALIVAIVRLRARPGESEARNWLIASALAYLTISPYLIATRGDWQLWTPWTASPGLPGEGPASLGTLPGAIIDSFLALFLPGSADPALNLPDNPWFGLLLLPWAAIGILGIINASNRPDLRDWFLVGLGIALAVWIGIAVYDAGHPGQLAVISPALAALTVYGFKTTLYWARVRAVRLALAGLIVVGVAGNAVISTQQYVGDWATQPETRPAFHVDVTDTLQAVQALDTDEPVFVSLTGRETILDYFRTPVRRHTFDGSRILPFPADESGYLVEPNSEPLAVELARLLDRSGSGTFALDAYAYRGFRLDARIREEMPLSAPTIPYPNGPALYGSSDPSRGAAENSVRFLVAWRSGPESPAFQIEARLQTTVSPREETTASTTLPSNPLRSGLFQVVVIEIELPTRDVPSDFQVRLRREDGTIVPVAGMDTEGYLLLNRYSFSQ